MLQHPYRRALPTPRRADSSVQSETRCSPATRQPWPWVRHGFAPLIRPVGGRMAPYQFETLLIDLAAPHPTARTDIRTRFTTFAEAIAAGLRSLGADARLGQAPDEHCPGEFSVNAGGHRKLAGVAQRVNRWGYVMRCARGGRQPRAAARAVTTDAYRALALRLTPPASAR